MLSWLSVSSAIENCGLAPFASTSGFFPVCVGFGLDFDFGPDDEVGR
jgi:hypothetical protein